MTLDFSTLNLFMVTLLLAAALVFAAVASHYRQRPGLWWWLLACLLIVAGYGLRWWHSLDAPARAYWFIGGLYIAGNLAFWIGIYQFCGIRHWLRPIPVALVVGLLWASAAVLPYPHQLAITMLLSALPNLLAYYLLRRAQHIAQPVLRSLIAGVFFVSGLVLLARGLAMMISDGQRWPISPEQLSALGALPSSALIILRCFALLVLLHARQEQELRQLAITDPLTGVLNRKGFMEHAQRLLDRQAAETAQVAVLMMDLDHFKRINDRYGHAAGDAVLRRFANLLREQLRPDDCSGRMGGEEFAALLPNVNGEAARHIAERLRQHVAQHDIATASGLLRVSVSIGVHATSQQPLQIEALLQQADQALYQAKENGRNQVSVSQVQ